MFFQGVYLPNFGTYIDAKRSKFIYAVWNMVHKAWKKILVANSSFEHKLSNFLSKNEYRTTHLVNI